MSRLSVAGSLPLPVPPERAWEAWSRVEDWPRWDWMGSASAAWMAGEPWALGSRLRVGHRPLAFECVIVEVRPPEAIGWAGRGAGIHTLHTFRFLPHDGGCLMRMEETFDGPGARLLIPLVRWFWGRQLRAFQRHLEAGRASAGRPRSGPSGGAAGASVCADDPRPRSSGEDQR